MNVLLLSLCLATVTTAWVSQPQQTHRAPTALPLVSSSSRFTGGGTQQVDMNRYNLDVDTIAAEWTAELQTASSLQEAGIYLGSKSKDRVFVDTVQVVVERRPGQGLGLELLELAGGREDGLGITVVNGIVEGSISEGSGVMVGDSISKIEVRQTTTKGNEESTEVSVVATECLGYDKTVESILSLPEIPETGDVAVLTLKRLRRKPKVTINLQYPPAQNEPPVTLELFAGENLRRTMLTKGIKLNDALSLRFDSGGTGDCGAEGSCATCVVSITKGEELLNPQGIQEQQILVKNPRWRLACRAIVGFGMQEGEMTVRVNPRQW